MDTVRVSGIRLFPDPANKTMQEQVAKIYDVQEPEAVGNPFFPMLVGMIFFLVSILVYPSTYFRHRPSPITYSSGGCNMPKTIESPRFFLIRPLTFEEKFVRNK